MKFRNEIEVVPMRQKGVHANKPYLIVSLDCLAEMMLEDPNGPTECDVAAVMALVCRAAGDSGSGDVALARKEQARYEEEARGGEDGDNLRFPEPETETGDRPLTPEEQEGYDAQHRERMNEVGGAYQAGPKDGVAEVTELIVQAAAGDGFVSDDDGPEEQEEEAAPYYEGWDVPDARDFL